MLLNPEKGVEGGDRKEEGRQILLALLAEIQIKRYPSGIMEPMTREKDFVKLHSIMLVNWVYCIT